MNDGESVLSLMEECGCSNCIHFKTCKEDAVADEGFSIRELGKLCNGYEERK